MFNIALGEELFIAGKTEEAEQHFRLILDEDPDNKQAYNNLGVISFQKGDIHQAIDHAICLTVHQVF